MAKAKILPHGLEEAGYELPTNEYTKILNMSLGGHDKSGKTDWSLRDSPDPIALVNINKGLGGVVQKFMKKKNIGVSQINTVPATEQHEAVRQWSKFRTAWDAGLNHARTMVVDTYGEIYSLAVVAEFGERRAFGREYGPLYSVLDSMLDEVENHNCHVILIHHLKAVYADDQATGDFVARGYRNVRAKVRVNAQIVIERNDANEWEQVLTIDNCRADMSLFGEKLRGKDCTFTGLGRTLYGPDWEP